MGKKNNHQCIICGVEYYSCDSCEEQRRHTPWRSLCDNFNHYQIHVDIKSYMAGHINATECIQKLNKLGIKSRDDYKTWPETTTSVLDEIFDTAEPKKASKKMPEVEAEA